MGVKSKWSAKVRTKKQIETCAKQWEITNIGQKKQQIREQLNPDQTWSYLFVHGNVKDPKELEYIEREGVKLFAFKRILNDLCTKQTKLNFSGSSAGDLVEIINFIQN